MKQNEIDPVVQTHIHTNIYILYELNLRLEGDCGLSVCQCVCVCVGRLHLKYNDSQKELFYSIFQFFVFETIPLQKKKRNGVTSELTSEVRTMMSAKTDASLSPLSLLLSFHILNQLIFVFSFNFFYAFEECITFFYCIHSIQYKQA